MLTTVSSRKRIDGYAGCGCGVGCGVGSVECPEPEFALLAEGTCFNVSVDDELVVAAPGEAPVLPGPEPGPGVASLVVVIRGGGGTRNERTGEAGKRPMRPDEGDAVERVRIEAGRADTGCTRWLCTICAMSSLFCALISSTQKSYACL